MEFRQYLAGDLAQLVVDEGLRILIADHPAKPELSWTLVDNKIIACGGFVNLWPGTYEAWLYIDKPDTFLKYKICLIKKFRNEIDNLHYHRLQATVDTRTANHERFMSLLGFHPEGRLEKYDMNQQDHVMYARIN